MSKITVDLEDIDLNKWKWLRKVSGLDQDTINYYRKLASKNEVLMFEMLDEDAFNIYIPEGVGTTSGTVYRRTVKGER